MRRLLTRARYKALARFLDEEMKRTFLITGASKGIGRATAELLVRHGHLVIGLARTVPNEPFPGEFIQADLSLRENTEEVLRAIAKRCEIDGFVNNVGLARLAALEDVTLEDFDAVTDLTERVALQVAQAFVPQMKFRGWGRIVNVASVRVLGGQSRSSYAAAKAGLVALTRVWALELATFGITVNCVAPGPVDTEMLRASHPKSSEVELQYLREVPMGRFAQPAEIAAAIGFLLSEQAGYITGQTLYIDGGMSVGKALI